VTDPILTVRDLRAGYGGEDILRGISIAVQERSIVAIIGPNGSGKSTLLKAIYGLIPVRAGSVSLAGNELAGMRPHRITALGMNMVPQLANVFADLSVFENLEVGAILNRPSLRERLDAVLAALPALRGLLSRRASTLSGGQRQMLAVGRALMSDPRLLILDEPSAGLAPRVRDEVFAIVRSINGLGVTVLMVEQRARQCLAIADYGYVLEQGRNRLEGPAQALLQDPEVVRLYLGVRVPS
jgi:ABC-type branched-subunit amino acid transport system ATPase component